MASLGRSQPSLVEEIRQAANGNFALGSSQFQEQIAKALGRRVTRGRSGRPRKKEDVATELVGIWRERDDVDLAALRKKAWK